MEEPLIDEITHRIVSHCHPQKIVLFGSQAWGMPRGDSDIDLFVIMNSPLRRDRRAVEISKLFPNRLFPLDVIVYTSEEVEMSLKRGNPFVRDILTRGKVLYAA